MVNKEVYPSTATVQPYEMARMRKILNPINGWELAFSRLRKKIKNRKDNTNELKMEAEFQPFAAQLFIAYKKQKLITTYKAAPK